MGTRVGLRHEPCVGGTFFVGGGAGLRLAVATPVSGGEIECREVQCRRFDMGVAIGDAAVYRVVSGSREATVVALMGSMAMVLMGGERVSVVAANLRSLRGVRFEWDPSGLWVDLEVIVANGVMRVYIGQRAWRLPCS